MQVLRKYRQDSLGLVVAFSILAVAVAIAIGGRSCDQQRVNQTLMDRLALADEDLSVARINNSTLESLLNEQDIDLVRLATQLEAAGAQLKEVKTVVRGKTVIQGAPTHIIEVPMMIDCAAPPEYRYQLENGIVVAEFLVLPSTDSVKYLYPVYDLQVNTDLVLTDKKAVMDVSMSSSYDPELVIHLKQEQLLVTNVRQHKIFEPHVSLGITASAPIPQISGSVSLSGIHPNENLDIGALRLSYGRQPSVGLDFVQYNIGSRLPVLTNTWLAPGIGYSPAGPIATLTIGAKL